MYITKELFYHLSSNIATAMSISKHLCSGTIMCLLINGRNSYLLPNAPSKSIMQNKDKKIKYFIRYCRNIRRNLITKKTTKGLVIPNEGVGGYRYNMGSVVSIFYYGQKHPILSKLCTRFIYPILQSTHMKNNTKETTIKFETVVLKAVAQETCVIITYKTNDVATVEVFGPRGYDLETTNISQAMEYENIRYCMNGFKRVKKVA